MRINIREIIGGRKPVHKKIGLDISDIVHEHPGVLSASPATAVVDAEKAGDFARVTGTLSCELELACSRCLKPFVHKMDIGIEEYFSADPAYDEDKADPDDERMIHGVDSDTVELDPYLKENLVVSIPDFPICREDCLGLCPVCGTDRNENRCECRQERMDPRWGGLKDWLEQ